MADPYYITTPIYYVNDVPHIGHAYTSIAADVLARFMRIDGRAVRFLTGTDEHGLKVEQKARDQGIAPQDFVDQVSDSFRALTPLLNLSNDDFIRTTEERHKNGAAALWTLLQEKGHIYESVYAGWYSVRDEAFYQESELVDGIAPTGAPVEWIEEPCFFFRLSAFGDRLLAHYDQNPDFIEPLSRRNEVKRFVEGGLNDLCISRSTFSWGIPVPGHIGHVMYVWLDALTNYISALGFPHNKTALTGEWQNAIHLVGKDILRFHAVYWPAFLMGADLPLPKTVFAHGWWTIEGKKMSKSLGNAISPQDLIDAYGVDPLRYFLMREMPFGGDGDFSARAVKTRINADLANDLGNLAQRVLSFIHKNGGAVMPTPGIFTDEDLAFLGRVRALPDLVRAHAHEKAPHKMLESIWAVVSDANRYVDTQEPWALRKTDLPRMGTVLFVLCDALRYLAILTSPFMPASMDALMDQLAIPHDARSISGLAHDLRCGTALPAPVGLFPRIES